MRKLLVLLVLIVAGCYSDGNVFTVMPQPLLSRAPVIADLELSPDTATYMEGNGGVRVTVQFIFADTDLDIRTLRVEMSDGASLAIDIPGPINTIAGTLVEEFDVSTTELGPCTIEVWLVDEADHSSNRLNAVFRVIGDAPADVATWLQRESGFPSILNDVNWNGSQFLAVGDSGTVMLSADGIAWTAVDSGTDADLNAIAWDGFDYAVVGDKGTVLISSDGENWTLQYQGADAISLRAAVYSGLQLIAAGLNEAGPDTAFIMSSMDHGLTWSLADVLPQSGRSITDIARGDSQLVATTRIHRYGADREARVLTSVDGLTWVEVVVSTGSVSTHSVLYDGSRYWAGGRVGRMYTSPDGINWAELQTATQATIFHGVAWSGTTLIADGENEWIGWGAVPDTGVASADQGASWTSFTIAADYDSRGLAWGNGRFVSVGCAGTEAGCAGFEQNDGGAIFSTP